MVNGAEPEHQRVVVQFGAHELIRLQSQTLFAVQLHGDACGAFPVGERQDEVVAAGCAVITDIAYTLVQSVVVHESALIARQLFLAVFIEFCRCHGAVPQTEFQHVTLVHHVFIPKIAAQIQVTAVLVLACQFLAAYLFAAVEERDCHVRAALVEHVCHFMQLVVEVDNRVRHNRLVVHLRHQSAVGSQSEHHAILLATVHERTHVALIGGRIQHHIHGETLVRQVSAAL